MSGSVSVIANIANQPRAGRGAQGAQQRGGSRLGFSLFLLVNTLLLIRPGELYPPLGSLHLYELSMIGCLVIYWPKLVALFTYPKLKANPITVCVVLLLPIITWSVLWQGQVEMLSEYGLEFLKIVLYFLILVCAIDTPARLRQFTLAVAIMVAIVGAVALVDYHDIYRIDAIKQLVDRRNSDDGKEIDIKRIQGVGIFGDPNDLAQMLGVGMVLCVYGAEIARKRWQKVLWIAPMLIMLGGIYDSHSRGGLLGLMAGLGILFVARFGIRRSITAGLLAMPVAIYFLMGTRTEISTGEASAQTRVQLWSSSLEALKTHLLFGIGAGGMGDFAGQVSHNSFLQLYAETGFVGGFLFFTAYAIAVWGVVRLRMKTIHVLDEDLAKLTPVLSAALVCYGVGMLTLTRNYVIPTYLMLGLANAYLGIVRTHPEKAQIRCGMGLLGRMFALAVIYLLAMQMFVKAFVHWG